MSIALHQPAAAEFAWSGANANPAEQFPGSIAAIAADHRPSRMPFFARLGGLPGAAAHNPPMLGQIYLVYQSAMHAMRAGIYFMPHLDSPVMRRRKLRIYMEDEGVAGGDTHHYQLARAFRSIGAAMPLGDEEFGDLGELCRRLDRGTAHFVRLARSLYSRSLGAWCIAEAMSDDWMRALAQALAVHHLEIVGQPYFAATLSHAPGEPPPAEAITVTQTVLRERPSLIEETLRDAEIMADALDGIWESLDAIVRAAADPAN